MKLLTVILRLIITSWLVYEIYIESGVYTAFAIALIGISVELHTIAIKAQLISIRKLTSYLFKD